MILVDDKVIQISSFIAVTFIYCIYYAKVRPFTYTIQNIVVIINECFILLIAGLFCGFLPEGDPDRSLAIDIIVIFIVDITVCFILGFGFQIYLINTKSGKNKEEIVIPTTKPSTENISENDENPKNNSERQLNIQNYKDEEEDAPARSYEDCAPHW